MSRINDQPPDRTPRFTRFEWATIIVLAFLAHVSTLLEDMLMGTFTAPSLTRIVPEKPLNYLLWGFTVALALRVAQRDGTATLYMIVSGMVFALVHPTGIAWAFGFVLAGVIIDTYMSGRRGLALAEILALTLTASLVNRSLALQQLLNSVTLDLGGLLGIQVPFFALILIVILTTLFGRLLFSVFEPANQDVCRQPFGYHGRCHPAPGHCGADHPFHPEPDGL